ncbi:MAG: Sir2 family NAD-dependent protein deacetylase [Gammaproteobacteria bacterium]|nr:Sir2 family NAD-dependent protein deacetylase [Gammaproteobacteria bacterium]MCY4199598.1 Sir2 family NAD-dependent protein deacetylase [Gammaproteobacteria bacterium]MCY4278753.1 Sir2 family NAD-dependent protein deacetylase [Gammaproteobacteria bacterium]MCY4322195.1 Sir2 family NAD-dependent protein deacetylase [Gammaproteobacteria bacterium]
MTEITEAHELAAMIDAAERVVFFTGAGISTESGVPDFRSPGGIWSTMKPIEFTDFVNSAEARHESWRRRFDGGDRLNSAQPNIGHIAIARLIDSGKASAVITQNVDNLHQTSGVPENKVIELHGNASYASCLTCGKRYELDELRGQWQEQQAIAPCFQCGGLIKSATISFGQAMPENEMRRAELETGACDLFMVVGSSLVVYPAAGFPELAKRRGARLVILNREATPLDDLADLVLHREIGPTLGTLVGGNEQ